MGYTHHWSNAAEFRPEAWEALQDATRKIIDKARNSYFIQVQYEYDEARPPQIDDKMIRFNGPDEDGHETFLLERGTEDYAFCKTNRKDYDAIVVAVLIAAAEYSTGFAWRSDGDPAEHADGLRLYNEATGNGLDESNVTPRD
jgi:hypothetical protein